MSDRGASFSTGLFVSQWMTIAPQVTIISISISHPSLYLNSWTYGERERKHTINDAHGEAQPAQFKPVQLEKDDEVGDGGDDDGDVSK